jgi:rSAM/selenodomain-associated transferase 1
VTENALILFLKYPQQGTVKTRLASTLGNDLAYELYRCFLADISVMTRKVNAQAIIVYSGPEGISFPDFPGVQCLMQRGTDIGERMYCAFLDVFSQGFERCVLTGSDIPDLPSELVNNAFDKLKSADVVLGPSTDGGYYLIGCKRDSLRQLLFDDIPWSTAGVLSETLKRIDKEGLEAAKLPQWSDIDDFTDLQRFYERNINQSTKSQVMEFLNTKGIINEQ